MSRKEMREVTIYSLSPKNFFGRIFTFAKNLVIKGGELLKIGIDKAVKYINGKINDFELYIYEKLEAKFNTIPDEIRDMLDEIAETLPDNEIIDE